MPANIKGERFNPYTVLGVSKGKMRVLRCKNTGFLHRSGDILCNYNDFRISYPEKCPSDGFFRVFIPVYDVFCRSFMAISFVFKKTTLDTGRLNTGFFMLSFFFCPIIR